MSSRDALKSCEISRVDGEEAYVTVHVYLAMKLRASFNRSHRVLFGYKQ